MISKLTKVSAATLIALCASSSVMAANNVKADHKNMSGKSINQALQLDDNYSFKHGKSFSLHNSNTKQRSQMFFKGVPVYGQSPVLELDMAGRSISLQGSIINGISADLDTVKPTYPKGAVISQLKKAFGHTKSTNEKVELLIIQDDSGKAQLVYKTEYLLDTDGEPSRPMAFISTTNGEILKSWDAIAHKGKPGGGGGGSTTTPTSVAGPGGNEKTGIYFYGNDFPNLIATTDGTACFLDSPNVRTVNMANSTRRGDLAQITCGDTGTDLTNGAFAPMNDGQAFGNVIFDMYADWYGVTPLSQKLEMRVHYGRNYENAFWDGTGMSFGDGASTFYPLVSLDVSAHEVSHGVTEQRSNLTYSGESGGMNEAFSDMAGEAAENYMNGTNDWMVGEQIFKGAGALRFMDNPTQDGRSIDNAADMTSGLDVHLSSGVYNKAFYLMSTAPGWSVQQAFGVMLRANDLYWTANSTFNSGACGVESAATDLGLSAADVSAAFSVVGVSCQ